MREQFYNDFAQTIIMKEAHGLSHELLLIKNIMSRQPFSQESRQVYLKSP